MKSQTIILATSITAIALVSAFLAAMVLLNPVSAATGSPSTTTPGMVTSTNSTRWRGPGGNFTPPFGGGFGGQGPFMNGGGQGGPGGGRQFQGGFGPFQGAPANLTTGEAITLTSTNGNYQVVNDSGDNGTASGTLTFTVTGKLSQGYTLSLSSGSISVGSTTYTVSSGSAQTGPGATNLEGQGATSSSGVFIVHAQARGSLAGSTATASLDLSAGGSEYLVNLTTSVSN